MKKKFVVGIDVSKDKLNIAFRSIQKDLITEEFEIPNSNKGISRFLTRKIFANSNDYSFVLEATGVYGLEFVNQAFAHEFDVCVLNPLIIKKYADMEMCRAKTDKYDAKIIAQYGCEKIKKLKYSKPRAEELDQAVSLLKTIEDYQLQTTAQNNRLHAVKLNPNASREVIKSLEKDIKFKAKEVKKLTDICLEVIMHFDKKYFKKLKKVLGVGDKTAMMIIAFYGKFELFETAKQVVSFAGINPKPHQSGTSVNRKGGISKKGNPFIRKILYMAALSAMKFNNSCKDLYTRLLVKGKSKKTALVAVANKLLRQIFAVGKFDREWQNNYVKRQ